MNGRGTGRWGSRRVLTSRDAASAVGLVLVLMAVLSVSLLLAGCGSGGGATTTTVASAGPGETTVVVTSVPSSTETTVLSTTSTSGITTTLSSTTTTELATTTTTTEALSSAETRLSSGHIKAMGFIDKVYVKDGKRYISIDYAQMLTGAAAQAAAIAEGFIGPGETLDSDYYISNVNPQKRTFEVSDSVAITTSTRWVAGDDMNAPCTWADFKSFWGPSSALDDSEKHLHAVPWWIERDGPVVVKIDEQYLP
jgi:hypothetical protein